MIRTYMKFDKSKVIKNWANLTYYIFWNFSSLMTKTDWSEQYCDMFNLSIKTHNLDVADYKNAYVNKWFHQPFHISIKNVIETLLWAILNISNNTHCCMIRQGTVAVLVGLLLKECTPSRAKHNKYVIEIKKKMHLKKLRAKIPYFVLVFYINHFESL